MPKADLVLEGGGVKGLGLVGAVLHLMRAGYAFPRIAGTSAGSILAAFLAAGASADDLAEIMDRLDYSRVPDRSAPGVPGLSEGIGLLHRAGAHPGDYIHRFIAEELEALGVQTFADLRRKDRKGDANLATYQAYKLVVTATDITRGRLLRLPWDYRLLNRDPDQQLVADAVRASISIPLFFRPVTVCDGDTGEERTLVDGGVLSNFPIEIFDRTDAATPRWPTLGVKVIPQLPDGNAKLFPGLAMPQLPPLHLLEQVVATAILGHDQTYLEQPCVRRRAIEVDTKEVGVVEFDADKGQRDTVTANGERAAREFLAGWDWERFKQDCVGVSPDAAAINESPGVTPAGGRRTPCHWTDMER
ncbi:MAG: patatin-like phospholipase family protein [Actinomycetota bacterium]|nr:patatin-like phospholipase family protein [Actinomycetota bacterium]